MNRGELIAKVAEQTGLSKKAVTEVVSAIENTVVDTVKKGEDVRLKFGKFYLRKRSARTGVNPQDPSKKIKIPASKSVGFKAGKAAKF